MIEGGERLDPVLPEEDGKEPARRRSPFIRLGETIRVYRFESAVPAEITNRIVASLETERNPSYGSSVIEDFIVDQLRSGLPDAETLKKNFLESGIGAQAQAYIDLVRERAESLDWEQIMNEGKLGVVREKLKTKMEELGFSEEPVRRLQDTSIAMLESHGASGLEEAGVYASRFQVVRRAMDYLPAECSAADLSVAVEAVVTAVIGHELGHKIDLYSGNVHDFIPKDLAWQKGGESVESPSERFAEYWGKVAVEGNETFESIRSQIKVLDVAKVSEFWKALAEFNANKAEGQKLDVKRIFKEIKESIEGESQDLKLFWDARQIYYSSVEPENYALPYADGEIREALIEQARSAN